MSIPVNELPIMKSCCKTCPFRMDEKGRENDPQLAAVVTERTLFKGQQICHGTELKDRTATHRCKGSWDFNKQIYDRMGLGHLVK